MKKCILCKSNNFISYKIITNYASIKEMKKHIAENSDPNEEMIIVEMDEDAIKMHGWIQTCSSDVDDILAEIWDHHEYDSINDDELIVEDMAAKGIKPLNINGN